MAERMTGIHLPGVNGSGLQDYGRKTPAEMIALIRRYARHQKDIYDKVLEAADEDFEVHTHKGVLVERDKEVIQAARKKGETT